MSFAKPIFTTRGKQIELQGIEGQQIIFTKIKIGDGRITTQSPSQLTDLINVIAEAPITSLKRYDAYAAIRSVFQNIDVPEAFWWREVGLFATDPATGEEVLYAYQNAYDTAEYITPSSLVTKKINWTIYIDDGENLGADIHKKMVFCSVEDLDEHNDLEGAHEPAFTAHNADTGSHTDIRNKIDTDISSHNTSTSAHENRFNEFVKGVTGSNATLTITKGNGMTSTVTVNNVANATKATQDSAGQQINTTYIKDLSVSGKTITYTKGNGTTGTIATQDTVYTHPNSGAKAGTYRSVTVNAQGHVTAGSNPTTLAGYGITDAPTKTGGGASGTWSINVSGKANTAGTADTSKACSGNSATATKLNNRGNQTAITAREEAGMYFNLVSNNGYPCSYGNVVTVGGNGGGQLLLGWSDTDKAIAPLYYRNRRDESEGWSEWRQIAFTTDLVSAVPVGTMQMFAGKTIPAGWLLCNGAAISRTTYSALYNVIGTTYGAGDGSTTFNLPLLTDNRFIEGSNTPGTQHKAGLPNITGTLDSVMCNIWYEAIRSGAITFKITNTCVSSGDVLRSGTFTFDASKSNSIYGASTTVQPRSLTMLPIIKY